MAYNSSYQGGYGQSNPYETPQQPYGQQYGPSSYTQQPPSQQSYQSYNQGGYNQGYNQGYGQDVEMQPIAGQQYNQGAPPTSSQDPNKILNDCRDVSNALDRLDSKIQNLQVAQSKFVRGTDNVTNREIDSMGADIMTGYRGLADQVKRIKSRPEAAQPRNKPQVDSLDRKIKTKINEYQRIESDFRRQVQDSQARQYKIVNPNATEAEIREATMDGGDTQIFQQALMNSDRRGQAQSTMRNVQQRHDAIQQIEKTMIELQQLFQDLDAIVVQQEPLVQNIEQKAEETNTHMVAGNTEVGKAVKSARAARKKKWICLGICVLIIVIILIAVLAYLGVTGQLSSSSNNTN